MDKSARSKSNDPQQEKLRSAKDAWNSSVKEFISRMIAFKRALNGRGDAHYSLPPSNIKDEFPSQIGSFLNTLSSTYEQLANEANRIEREQSEYSKNRKKPIKQASSNVPMVLIGNHKLETMLAITAEEQEVGLMHREWPPPVMSFVYSSPRVNRFWMKKTPSPLDIVFSVNGTITQICRGEPFSTKLIGDYQLSDLVVELPYGTCEKLGVQVGDNVSLLR